MRLSLVLLAAAAALAFTAVAGAAQPYAEPTGDAGAAPDLGQTTVDNDPREVVFRIGVPARFPEPDEMYLLRIDADTNPGTGDEGDDVRVVQMGTSANVMTWNGSDWVDAPSSGIHVRVEISASAGEWVVTLPRTLLSNTSGFVFMIMSAKFSGDDIVGTDVTGPWRYDVVLTQCSNGRDDDADGKVDLTDHGCQDGEDDLESDDPYTLSIVRPTVTPAVGHAGKPIVVRARVTRVETQQPVQTGSVRCTATLGRVTKHWAGRLGAGTATCTVAVPKTARRTTIRGTIKVSSRSRTTSAPFSFRIG
jgi:hypothetical protein